MGRLGFAVEYGENHGWHGPESNDRQQHDRGDDTNEGPYRMVIRIAALRSNGRRPWGKCEVFKAAGKEGPKAGVM